MKPFWMIFLLAAALAACSPANSTPVQSEAALFNASLDRQQPLDGVVVDAAEEQPQEPLAQVERIILKNAALSITVDDAAAKISAVAVLAESLGGWVVSSNTYTSTDSAGSPSTYGSITVRIPAERLAEAIEQIKAGTVSVESEQVSGQDVTADYVDLSAQLRNLEATEKQLQSIMERANRVEDVLAVQRELTTVQGQIESIQGRLKYYDEAAAFSSIQVEARPVPPGPIQSQSAGWNPLQTVERAFSVLVGLLQSLIDAGVAVIVIALPLALLFGLPVWLLWRALRRRRTRTTQPLTSP